MKQIFSSIREFIKDFDLEHSEGPICFDAVIYFTTVDKSFQLPTEVQIMTIGQKKIDVIYLLHPDVAKLGIPDIYEDGEFAFIYVTGKALVVKGATPEFGKFTLSIHLQDVECNEETLAEIHAKTYN
jgi:hypothetical protein